MKREEKVKEKIKYMYDLERFGIKLDLEVMSQLMEALNNPQKKITSIHITGTNGKGSTASMIESVLRTAGFKTGLYTSPHLFSFNERIKVSGNDIPDGKLAELIERVRVVATKNSLEPTFFEFTTAIALMYFAEQKTDIAIIEVGMGGLLDATNVITPIVSVITNIGLDHSDLLGNTKIAIAKRKAGIIKKGIEVVTAENNQDILNVFKNVCQKQQAKLHIVNKEISFKVRESNWSKQIFSTQGIYQDVFSLSLLGEYQVSNACTAMCVLNLLNNKGFITTVEEVKKGLAHVVWPGRLDVVSKKPLVLIDGAHNSSSIKALRKYIIEKMPSYDVLIFGIKEDKDPIDILDNIVPLFKHVIITEGSYKPKSAIELTSMVKNGQAIPDTKKAINEGIKLAGPIGSILITGSLYMIPEALGVFKK